jgi:hypothetical protein
MEIEVCAQWDRMSMQEAAAQIGGKFNAGDGIDAGNVGYLHEPYYGEPYATKALVPEAFRYGRARIAASSLQKRLPEALHIVERRERLDAFSAPDESAIERLQKHIATLWRCAPAKRTRPAYRVSLSRASSLPHTRRESVG